MKAENRGRPPYDSVKRFELADMTQYLEGVIIAHREKQQLEAVLTYSLPLPEEQSGAKVQKMKNTIRV